MKKTLLLSSLLLTSAISLADSRGFVAKTTGEKKSLVASVVDMTKEAQTKTLERVDEILAYLEGKDLNEPDVWLFNPRPEAKSFEKIAMANRPKDNLGEWLELHPGDVIYYRGVSGFKAFTHTGVYLGNGLVYEKWSESTDDGSEKQKCGCARKFNEIFNGKGEVVINAIENFATAAEEVRSFSLKGSLSRRSCLKNEPNYYRQVNYVTDDNNNPIRVSYKKIKTALQQLKTNGGKGVYYNALSANCITESASVSGHKRACLPASLQTAHLNCQGEGPRVLRRCDKVAKIIYATTGVLLSTTLAVAAALLF